MKESVYSIPRFVHRNEQINYGPPSHLGQGSLWINHMDAVDMIVGQKNNPVDTPSYLNFIQKPMKPSYQELEELVKAKDVVIDLQQETIRVQEEKIHDLKEALHGTWEAVDLKIDHAKSIR